MISIITPVHNMKHRDIFLDRLKQSIEGQTYKDYEWIVMEEGLMAHNINEGIKKAKGDVIKLMCMDDYFAHPNSLQEIADVPEGRWSAAACGHIAIEEYQAGPNIIPAGVLLNEHKAEWGDRMLEGYNTLGGLSVVAWPREGSPYFDERLSWLIDVDFYQQLFDKYGPPVIINDINVVIGIGPHQTTHLLTNEDKLKEEALVKEKYNL